ncbi:NUDIX domain protein [Mycobacterium xenopi 4042]|uniref:NUDIX domain protein n=1 Tax=Mycobacterium xenopi 4042 TaxID=1299334 RepID=X7YKR5_MYCXE|nr:NUDIX domain protein [Mycobacterium xenopi 4042]
MHARDDACSRDCVPGHVTASTLVTDATGSHTLLTLHPRLGRWVQLGGHCDDGDDDIVAAALREASEESGIAGLRINPELMAVHVHPVTCSLGVPTRHLDLQFVARAPRARKSRSARSRWICDGGPSTPYPKTPIMHWRGWFQSHRPRKGLDIRRVADPAVGNKHPGHTRAPRRSSHRAPMSAPSPITPSRISARDRCGHRNR